MHTHFFGGGYWVHGNACSDRNFLHLLFLLPPAFIPYSTSALLTAPPTQTGTCLAECVFIANFLAQSLFFSRCTTVGFYKGALAQALMVLDGFGST